MTQKLPEKVLPGDEIEVQLTPFGEFPQTDHTGKEINQLVDRTAIQQLIENFSSQILVDADHSSETGENTQALAWITSLSQKEDGLYATFKFTDLGSDAVTFRRYRFLSPCWTLDSEFRPLRLISCGLTNKPNLPVKPILNAQHPKQGQNKMLEQLKEILSLEMTAPDEAILEAVAKLKEKLAEVEAEKIDAEAEAFATENECKTPEERETMKNMYKRCPEAAQDFARILNQRTKAKHTIINSTTAKTPTIRECVKNATELRSEMSALPPKDRQAFYTAHKDSFTTY